MASWTSGEYVATTYGSGEISAPTATGALPVSDGLPELPWWFIHAFAGLASFVLVVGVVLYMAQFPESLAWARNMRQRRNQGYDRLEQEDIDLDGSSTRARSSGVATGQANAEVHGRHKDSESRRQRRPRDLSINTTAQYKGLGIAVPGDGYQDELCDSAHSQQNDNSTEDPPPHKPWLTAPLPSVSAFFHSPQPTTNSWQNTEADVESGHAGLLKVPSPEIFHIASPVHNALNREHEGGKFLQRVNDGITYVADRLSRRFNDQVTGPEEGLLLSVRGEEREQKLVDGVFVE